jgi:hypothetical protein
MAQYAIETRHWLESAIKQRKLLLKTNHSRKSGPEVEVSVQVLDTLLKTWQYSNDVYMARFITQNISSIEIILPGSGATSHAKRMRELDQINKQAIQILDGATAQRRNGITVETPNTKQYEMEF